MEFNAPFNMTELEDALANSNNCAVTRDKLHCEMLNTHACLLFVNSITFI